MHHDGFRQANSDDTVTVLRVGNNLVVRRGAIDFFSTAVEEVGTLTIIGQIIINGNAGNDTHIGSLGADQLFANADTDLGLGGNGAKNTGDVLDASFESINEAFNTIFAFE